jgi:Flp pilus assembly protein TadG
MQLRLSTIRATRPPDRRGLSHDAAGAVAMELAVATPFLALLIIGLVDFSVYINGSQAIAAATRVGAEFARDSSTCRNSATGISYAATAPTIGAACATGINAAMQDSAAFSPALTNPASPACGGAASMCLACYCASTADPNTYAPCTVVGGVWRSCFTDPPNGYTGPNRVFVMVTARQTVTPLFSWPGFPTELDGLTELRIQ